MVAWELWEACQVQCKCQVVVVQAEPQELHHQVLEQELLARELNQEPQVLVVSEVWAAWVAVECLEEWTHK